MLETLIAAVLLTGGVVAITRTPSAATDLGVVPIPDLETVPDLPCPWCQAQTNESDARCPSCGQRFG